MRPQLIEEMKRRGYIVQRSKDIPRIRSLLTSSTSVASAALTIPLTEENATLIFRELYESIRQLGDALWWALGYEPDSHEASMKILTEIDIKEKLSLYKLDRFRKIRHDSHYRGYLITPEQTREIITFWKKCSQEIIALIEKKAQGE